MARLLQKEGYDIFVVTPKIYKKSGFFENQDGIKIYRFPFFAGDKLLIEHKKIPFLRMCLYFLTGFIIAFCIAIKHRCSIVHVHWAIPTGLIGLWIKYVLGKPMIVTIHGSDLRMALEKKGVLKRIFLSVCRNATHIHCVSDIQKKEMMNLSLPETKISVVPMGVDDGFFECGRGRKEGMKNHQVTVISNRNLLPIYNVSLLIQAMPIVLEQEPDTKLLIAGDGSLKEDLEKAVKNLNIDSSVLFLGRVPHQEMPGLLSQADIYVSTSLHDGTSVSLLEAMGAGAFPIVSDIPANQEWIQDGKNGFLFPVNGKELLAGKILNAIHNHEMIEKAREWNLSLVENKVSWPVCIHKIKRIYDKTNITNDSK